MTTTARRITVKQQGPGLVHATTRGAVYVVVVERGAWTIYAPNGDRVGIAGWTDWDTDRRSAQLRDLVRAHADAEDAKPSEEELEAGAARQLAEVRAEVEAEAAAALELEAELAAVARAAEANRTARVLGWTERHLAVVEHAAGPGIVDADGAYRMRPGGRRIATDVVDDLVHAGFLEDADGGRVVASADGLVAMRAVRASTLPFVTPEGFAAHRQDVARSMAVASRRTLQLLPPLPGGVEVQRRATAAAARNAQYEREAAARRAEAEAIRARAEAAHQAEVQERRQAAAAAEEQAQREYMSGCGQCPDTVAVAARCGVCRDAVAPAPQVVRAEDDLDDVLAEEFAEQAAHDAAQGPVRRAAVRAEVSRHHQVGGRGLARVSFPAARAHRAREARAVVVELAALFGVQVSTPRRLLADGTHGGAELWRQLDLAGPARAVEQMLAALGPVLDGLERLATRAARRLGTWRRSLMATLGGHLDDLTPDQRARRAREFRTAVLEALTGFMRPGAPVASGTDVRAALWDQVAAVAAEVWALAPVDPWALAQGVADVAAVTSEQVAAATLQPVVLVSVDRPAPAVALAA